MDSGIGGYDLKADYDQAFAYDYDSSGKLDHLVLYRPGKGAIFILRNGGGNFQPVYAQGVPGNGIGGYDLKSGADRVFSFDYDSSGKPDHLVLYRPGTGTIWILRNNGGNFQPVYAQGAPGNGIGGYDLKADYDQAFAYDYDSSGKLDHLVLYRPGKGAIFILRNGGGNFQPVYAQGVPGNGIGGYDLQSGADRVFSFDYDSSGKPDHLVLYRPGTGTIWILRNNGGNFQPVYAQGAPGNGIGGYDLKADYDQAFAYDYDSSGKLDHLVLYRPGKGAIFILRNVGGNFQPVYAQGVPGNGIGGYDLKSGTDRVFSFDYDSSGKPDHLVLYRPGTGTIWILDNSSGSFRLLYPSRVLPINVQHQEQSNWCWAAAGSAVGGFYDNTSYSQCWIVTTVFKRLDKERGTHIFDNVNCCGPDDPSAQPCNGESGADQAMNTPNQHFDHNVGRPLTFDELRSEIDNGRPFCAEISWSGGGGAHFVVIAGYGFTGNPPVGSIFGKDPFYGNTWIGYSDFATHYQGSGSWVSSTLSKP